MKLRKKDDELLWACEQSDLAKMEELVNAGISVDGVDGGPSFARPLASALLCKQWKAAHWLLDHDADPATGGGEMDDAIEQLSKDRDGEISRLVDRLLSGLEGRDDVEIEKITSRAFYKACEFGHLLIAQRILKLWEDPSRFESRHSPVGWAAINNHHQVVAWLCKNGFDHRYHREDELPPVVYAILGRSPLSVKALLAAGESPGRTAMAHKFRLIRAENVDDLPSNDRYEIFHEGTLLHFAVIASDPQCVDVLLEAGADPNARDSDNRTPLMLAKLGGLSRKPVAERLAPVSEDVPLSPDEAFRQGVLQDDLAAVRDSLAQGVDHNQAIKSKFGIETRAMTIAARRGNIPMLETLVVGGVEVDQLDCSDKEPVTAASASFMIEEMGICFLQDMNGVGRTPFLWAAADGKIEAMDWLVKQGADKHATDSYRMNALHVASLQNQEDAIDWLLEKGLDIERTAVYQLTPLHIAAAGNSRQAVIRLLHRGADPSARNANRETPYDMAKDCGKPATYRVLEPVTPKEVRKRHRKPTTPAWEFDAKKRNTYLAAAMKSHGKEAGKLASAKGRRGLAQRGRKEAFQAVVNTLADELSASQSRPYDDAEHVCRLDTPQLTDHRVLKLQRSHLKEQIMIVRQLLGNQKDRTNLYVIAADNLFEAMASMGLSAANDGISTKQLIAWLMSLHERHAYQLLELRWDGLTIQFDGPIPNPSELVDEVMMICPPDDFEDRVLKSMRKRFKNKRPKLSMWWD